MTKSTPFGIPTSASVRLGSVTLDFDLGLHDAQFARGVQAYTVHYALHLPAKVDPSVPVLLLCHRELGTVELGSGGAEARLSVPPPPPPLPPHPS